MATSGSIDFSTNRDDIITEALEQLGVLAEGESPNADQLTSMSRTLNLMVKAWQGEGLNLFALQRMYLFPQKSQRAYTMSSGSADHVTTSFITSTITQAASETDSSIVVSAATSMSAADYIGVELDSGSLQWTTINGAPSSNTITLTAALTDDVSVGARVYTYTSKANRPMKLYNVTYRNAADEHDTPISIMTRDDYISLSEKTSSGQPNQVYYDPQVNGGVLYTWPQPDSVDSYFVLWAQRTLEDFDTATDTPDYPQEWLLPLALNLALLSTNKYNVPRDKYYRIKDQATYYKKLAESFDVEGGFQIQAETR